MPTGIPNFVAAMEKEVPGSAESVSNFFKLAGDVGRGIGYLSQGQPDPAVLGSDHINFMKVASHPVGRVLDELQMPKKAQDILCTYWPYMGTPRSEFSFALYALMVYRYISLKAYIPKNRSYEMALALEKRIRDLGGDFWMNTSVAKILVKDGRAYGIVTHDGREIHGKQIIANVSPHQVYGSMIDPAEVPVEALKLANARKHGMSSFCVFIGLGKSPEELGIKDYSVFISSTPDSDESYKRMYTLDDNDFFIMNCLNIEVPDCSPEGTSLLWATQLYGEGSWDSVDRVNYSKEKNRLAKRIIDRYEEVTGITIHDCIEEISVSTPATFARYLSTPHGSIYGYHGQPWDSLLPRTMAMKDEQYIEALRFAGGYSTRMLGFSSTYLNGEMMAKLAALDIKEGR
jgi:prolycopene isomerase